MKVAFYLENLEFGGVQKRTLKLINGLVSSDQSDIEIVLFVKRSGGALVPDHPAKFEIVFLDERRTLPIFSLLTEIRNSKPDIIIAGFGRLFVECLLLSLFFSSFSKLCVIQAVPITLKNQSFFKNLSRLIAVNLFYRFAKKVICVSKDVERSIFRISPFLKRKTVTTIYNPVVGGVSFEGYNFSDLEDKKPCVLSPEQNCRLLAVGRLDVQKDYITLLKSIKRVVEKRPNLVLNILGDGPLLETLTDFCSRNDLQGNVNFKGFVSDVGYYYRNSDLFVMSSLWEGLPNAMIEALAYGLPVVSTDCIAGPREILCDGEFGSLVPIGDHVELASKIELALTITVDYGKQSKRAMDFSVEKSVEKYVNLFKEILIDDASVHS